jgi:multidrug efflux pump subunit AcrA (membrane-fusion protein)
MKARHIVLIVLGAAVVVAAAAFIVGWTPFSRGSKADPAQALTKVKVSRGDIVITVPASGKLEPNEITTVRPDSNMPSRKLERILVSEGQLVQTGQVVALADASGLDLDRDGALAEWEAQKLKLSDLKAKPTQEELTTAKSNLAQAQFSLKSAQAAYDSARKLFDKGLASQDELTAAQSQLSAATSGLETAQLQYDDTVAGATEDSLRSQEAAVAQAENTYLKARLALEAAQIRSPVTGTVVEVLVSVGDIVSPTTAVLTVADLDPMILQAEVDENDVGSVKTGQKVTVVPFGLPDSQLTGTVKEVSLKATLSGNVTVFNASIEVPNRGGRLLWGMNADATITVSETRDVLTLPTSAVQASGGTGTVSIEDEGKVIPWQVRTGATDGSHMEIVSGLEEGDEVIVQRRSSNSSSAQQGQNRGGGEMMFRVLH